MKKIVALLLSLVLVFGLVACGGSTSTTPPDILDNTEPEAPAEPELPGIPDEPEAPEQWEGDYESATFADIRKYGYGSTKWDGVLPLTTTGEKLEFGMRAHSRITDYETNPLTVWLEEKTGIDISIRMFSGAAADYNTQIALMFSGGEDLPDIIYTSNMSNDARSEYVAEGYLQNLAGYFMTDAYYWTQALELCCKDDPGKYIMMLNNLYNYTANQRTGQVYGVPRILDNPTDVVHLEANINTEWLKTLGLQKPTTIDELYDVLVAFRDRDPNGNGKKDEIPMMGRVGRLGQGMDNYLINAFIQYSPSRKAMIEDGKAFSYHDQDEYRQALIFMNKLVEEGLLSPLSFTGDGSELQRLLNPVGSEPFTIGIACAYITGNFVENSRSWQIYEPLPALKDVTGRGGYSMFDPPTVDTTFGITWCCENVQLAFRLLDFMHSQEAYLRQRWGEEGVDWDWIENTEYKDLAKGNGVYGGDAAYVNYNDGWRNQSRWYYDCGWADEMNLQIFSHPDKGDFVNTYYKKSADNVLMQKAIGQPEEELLVFVRTPEEDELFHEFNAELSSVVKTALSEFCLDIRDPSDDAQWQAYLGDLKLLKYERWAELGQASYDRQKAELDAYLAKIGK